MELVASKSINMEPQCAAGAWGNLLAACLLCPVLPAKAARRAVAVPVVRAYLVHAVFTVGIVLTILSAIAFVETPEVSTFGEWGREVVHVLGIFLQEFVDHPLPMFLAVFAIELGYAALSLLLVAWGACDESPWESIKHALRRVWMQTPQLLLFVMAVSSGVAAAERAGQQWDAAHPVTFPTMPVQPPGIKQNTPQWDQYIADVQAYYEEMGQIHSQRRAEQPWFIRSAEALVGVSCFTLGCCFVGSLLRAVGVARSTSPIARQPLCEACGYDLTTMPLESRCPECGETVGASLGAEARPGPPWVDPRLNRAARWMRTWKGAVFTPKALGRTIRTVAPGTAHRSFLFLHLPLVFFIGAVTPLLAYRAVEGHYPTSDVQEFYFVLPAGGILCVVGVMAMSLKFAAWTGWYFWWRDRRNLLSAAIQATCYLTPFLVAWEICGGAAGILAMWLSQHPDAFPLLKSLPIHRDTVLWNAWMILNLIWLAIYIQLIRRIVAEARYANK